MDRRIGLWCMSLSALAGIAMTAYLAGRHGWQAMPPMVPVFLLLMIAAPLLATYEQDMMAWAAAILLLFGVVLFGLSTGFLIGSAVATVLGMVLATIGTDPNPVPA